MKANPMQANRQRLIRELFDEYIEMYAARDDRLTGRFSENFSGYTGGGNSLVKDVNEWVRITRQDFAQVTGRIRIEMLDLSMQDISDDVVVVTAFFHIHLPMPDRVLSRETARLVLVFRLEGTDWKIAHSGISIPYQMVQEGEVYPLKGLRARNNELAALVEQGTQALNQSEARFRSFVENLNDLLFVLTPSGEFSYLSPQWQESFGYELGESVGQSFATYVHPQDVSGFFSFLNQILDSGEKHGGLEYRVRCKDGNYKWHTANASRLSDAAKGTLAVIGIGRDITERKRDEAVIKASEQRFRDLVNTTDGIVWEADASTFNFTFISEKAERLLGFPAADWLQPGFWVAHLHPQDQTWAPAYCASCTGRLEPHDFEYRFIARDGRTVWLRDIVTVVAENGQPRWLRGVMVDVSQQKLMEAQLQEARQVIEDVQRISRLGGWKFDCATAKIIWTPEVYQIYGVSPEFDPGDPQQNIGFYHPDDAPTITQAFRRALEHAEPYDLELRLNRPDGQTIWIRTVGRPQVESGKVLSVTGTILDITERKRTEE